jgi:hypothetical protein
MTFREKVTRTELKALTESNPRWRLFAGLAAAEPSTQHHHSGYRKEWCLDCDGSERQKPNLVFCLLVHRQATMGRPESFHRKSPQTASFFDHQPFITFAGYLLAGSPRCTPGPRPFSSPWTRLVSSLSVRRSV